MKYVRIAAWLVVAVVSAVSFAVLLSPTQYEIAGIRLEISLAPNMRGGTELVLPPIGALKAKTHQVPLRLVAKVEGVDQAELAKILPQSQTSKDYFDLVQGDARHHTSSFFLKLIALAAFGGLIGSLFFTRSWPKLIGGSLVGMAAVGMLLAGLYLQYDIVSFTQPEFSGPLSSARWVAASIDKENNPVSTLREDIRLAVKNLASFAAKIEAWQPVYPDKKAVRVLVASDIHNNPAGFALIRRVAHDFRADFVIDAGDITDFGTPIEAGLLSQLTSFDLPYLFVPGNHDSQAVVETMIAQPQVKILEDSAQEVKGIKVYGSPDPLSQSMEVKPASDKEMKKSASKAARHVATMSKKPLIVAMHDPRMSEQLTGKVPIIINGHTHRPSVTVKGKTTVINPGSTGASGVQMLNNKHPQELKFTVSLLYIDPVKKKLIAVDSIQVTGLEGEFTLQRKLVLKETDPAL